MVAIRERQGWSIGVEIGRGHDLGLSRQDDSRQPQKGLQDVADLVSLETVHALGDGDGFENDRVGCANGDLAALNATEVVGNTR
jgi:hypothetical protein